MAFLPSAKVYAPMRIHGMTPGSNVQQVISLADEVRQTPTRRADHAAWDSGSGAERNEVTSTGSAIDEDVYVVRSGDTLWSIAGRELGSPLRWREIAALNIGRPQADGTALVNAGWILPGWVLALPPAAKGAPHEAIDDGAARHKVEGAKVLRESVSRHADARLKENPSRPETARSSLTHVSIPTTVTPVVTTDSASEREPPGDGKRTPIVGGSEGSRGSGTPVTSSPGASDGGGGVPHQDSTRDTYVLSGGDHDSKGVPVAPFGYGLLGAGVVMVINRLRRAQQRHRPSGLRIALPDKDLAGAEQILRSSADHEAAAWVDAALRTLAAACRSNEREAPASRSCPRSR